MRKSFLLLFIIFTLLMPRPAAAQASGPVYIVQSGDTLWSIAANPHVFGDATKWRKLFSANQDIMKSPDAIRAGMTLRVPRGAASRSEPSEESSGATIYTK